MHAARMVEDPQLVAIAALAVVVFVKISRKVATSFKKQAAKIGEMHGRTTVLGTLVVGVT